MRGSLAGLVTEFAAIALALGPGASGLAHQPRPEARAVARIDYVALGDSFSAGPLIADPRQDPVGCLRSTNNYPAFLAGYLNVRSYRDVTCSGATTDDMFARQRPLLGDYSPPPQLDALRPGTDLVTLGIGGNDFGLFGEMIGVCGSLAASDPQGAPCQAHFTDANGADTKARDATAVEANLTRVLTAIRERAPHAKIYVIGYPRLLPTDGRTCAAAPLATGDYPWATHIEILLNTSLRNAAAATGATYLTMWAASKGHDICAGSAAWINGKDLVFGMAADYHPFRVGMRGEARSSYRRITGKRAPTNQYAAPPPGAIVVNPAT